MFAKNTELFSSQQYLRFNTIQFLARQNTHMPLTYQELMIINFLLFLRIHSSEPHIELVYSFVPFLDTQTSSSKLMLFEVHICPQVSLVFKLQTTFLWPALFPCLLELIMLLKTSINMAYFSQQTGTRWFSWPESQVVVCCLTSSSLSFLYSKWFRLLLLVYTLHNSFLVGFSASYQSNPTCHTDLFLFILNSFLHLINNHSPVLEHFNFKTNWHIFLRKQVTKCIQANKGIQTHNLSIGYWFQVLSCQIHWKCLRPLTVFKKLSYLYMDTVKIVCCSEFSPEFELNYVIM